MVVLKAKHSLHGKNLIPLVIRLKEVDINNIDADELARLKKDHTLDRYTLEELEGEFLALTGKQSADFYTLAGKPRQKETAMALMNLAIYLANDIGIPKATPLNSININAGNKRVAMDSIETPRQDLQPSQARASVAVESEKVQSKDSAVVEDRMQAVERAIQDLKQTKGGQVEEALRQINVLAGRPRLTSPAVIIAAVESLVDIATRYSHKDLEFYCKALQACRRFESSPDLCSLCLRLFGSQEDKKISAAVAEWSKQQKYGDVKDSLSPGTGNGAFNAQGAPQFPFWPQQPWGPPGGQQFPQQGQFRPYPVVGGATGSGRPRMGGVCFYCKARGHYVARCPKINGGKENK